MKNVVSTSLLIAALSLPNFAAAGSLGAPADDGVVDPFAGETEVASAGGLGTTGTIIAVAAGILVVGALLSGDDDDDDDATATTN